MKIITSQISVFEELLGDINYKDNTNLYPFKVRVGVIKYRPPRHEFFEVILNMGYTNIEPILYHKKFNPPPTLNFVFPERFMSVHEQYAFMSKLKNHPEVNQIKQVDIITSNPMITSNFKREMIRSIQWPKDDKKYEKINDI